MHSELELTRTTESTPSKGGDMERRVKKGQSAIVYQQKRCERTGTNIFISNLLGGGRKVMA